MMKKELPNLKTVLLVEDVLRKADTLLTREKLKRRLPIKITYKALNPILKHFEDRGKILDGRKGILWVYTKSKKLKELIKRCTEV